MKAFEDLGRRVAAEWRRLDDSYSHFPDIAVNALTAFDAPGLLSPEAIMDWVSTCDTLPVQNYRQKFADMNLVVYRGQRFYVEVLFWVDGTTSIHQHSFSGAFCVLAGSSLHSTFSFARERGHGDHVQVGELRREGIELLEAGSVRPILSGSRTIHSLFHLDQPSITVVVRTYHEGAGGPQFSYSRPGLAIDPFFDGEVLARRRELLAMVRAVSATSYRHRLQMILAGCTPIEQLVILDDAHVVLKGAPAEFEAVVREGIDPTLAPHVLALHRERRRVGVISQLRRRVVSPEHRFFLALMLNAANRADVLTFVHARFPGARPTETLAAWFDQLTEGADGESNNALGIAVDDLSRHVFRALVAGASTRETLGYLGKHFDEADVGANRAHVEQLVDAFRASPLFQTLFAA